MKISGKTIVIAAGLLGVFCLSTPAQAGYAAGAYAYVHQKYTDGTWAKVWYAAGGVINYSTSSSAVSAAKTRAVNKLPYRADYSGYTFYANGSGYCATATGGLSNLVVVANGAYRYSTQSGAITSAVNKVKNRGAKQWVYVYGRNS